MKLQNILATRKLLAILSFAICLSHQPSSAVARDEIPAAQEQRLFELFKEGKCDQVWRELWRNARLGNEAALEELAKSFMGGIYPPSYFPETKEGLALYAAHNAVALMLYARKSFSRELRNSGVFPEKLMDLIGGYYEPEVATKARTVNKCFERKSALDTCYNMAVEYKLIPTFEQYVAFIDNAPRPAFCLNFNSPAERRLPTDEDLGLSRSTK